jgi:uncharacterized protein YdhG (YjbR/CyaY superfamily)
MADDPFDEILAGLSPAARAELSDADALIRRLAPSLRRGVSGGFVGYGTYRYRYATGREGEGAVLALAARKAGLSLYVGPAYVERWADRLPRADVGKGCIRVKHAADLDEVVLGEIVAAVVPADGHLVDWSGTQRGDVPEPVIRD